MNTFAAVMTGKGTGAISTIQVFGDSAEPLVKKIFKPTGSKPAILKPGKILLGQITDGSETIDQVVVGCETVHSFAINCHGNPLIVADIMKALARHGAILLTAEELLAKILSAQKHINTIELEAKSAQPKAKTIEGTKIIANQIDAGLSGKAKKWLQSYGLLTEKINAMSLREIRADAEQILEAGQTAKLIITGCTMVLSGPPNTGKSTLLNYLAGRQKAIVTDIKGTTRDWVSTRCKIAPLSVELIDTAGLDEKLSATSKETIEKLSQQKTAEVLEKADIVLLVLDSSQTADQLDEKLLEKIADKKNPDGVKQIRFTRQTGYRQATANFRRHCADKRKARRRNRKSSKRNPANLRRRRLRFARCCLLHRQAGKPGKTIAKSQIKTPGRLNHNRVVKWPVECIIWSYVKSLLNRKGGWRMNRLIGALLSKILAPFVDIGPSKGLAGANTSRR